MNHIKQILFATSNKAKFQRIKDLTYDLPFKWISLSDLNYTIPEPEETGKDGAENSGIKANYYFKEIKGIYPVIAQDDTLFIKGISRKDNPGKDIKEPVIKKYGDFTDNNAYKYYINLIKQYKCPYLFIEFRYGHAYKDNNNFEISKSILKGRIVPLISKKRTPGYFLADIMQVEINGIWKFYSELSKDELIQQDQDIKRSVKYLLNKYL